ncbi:unnamed protein product [Schistosoma mattheei]|uniref:Uncharacterized protein n=1 Tax=Schistosoma mattheei TaxID=31246 RepID=A0A3P8KUK4_9TREM|nr:unnamed protein product [Schistosoma mattheei]
MCKRIKVIECTNPFGFTNSLLHYPEVLFSYKCYFSEILHRNLGSFTEQIRIYLKSEVLERCYLR